MADVLPNALVDVARQFTVTGIVLDEDQVLLVEHRKSGLLLGPGGHVESEDPAQAVRREIFEEVGIEVTNVSEQRFTHPAVTVVPAPFTVVDIPASSTEPAHQHVDLVYVCRPLTHDIIVKANEINGCRWVPLADVASLATPPEYPALVAAAAKYADAIS